MHTIIHLQFLLLRFNLALVLQDLADLERMGEVV